MLRAGTDVDCGPFSTDYARSALDKGFIHTEDVDARLRRLMRVRFRLGHSDPEGPLDGITELCSADAQRAGRQLKGFKRAERLVDSWRWASSTGWRTCGPLEVLTLVRTIYIGVVCARSLHLVLTPRGLTPRCDH